MTHDERLAQEERSKELLKHDDFLLGLDEQHLRSALYLVQKAVALRELSNFDEHFASAAMLHATLRDASLHLEAARGYWTKESVERGKQIFRQIFPEEELQPG